MQVDYGVRLTPRNRVHGGFYKYPWDQMEIGDSFFVPNKAINIFAGQACNRAKRHGGKYTCRSVVENGVAGTRVWRVG
jgi:hypothetical protein